MLKEAGFALVELLGLLVAPPRKLPLLPPPLERPSPNLWGESTGTLAVEMLEDALEGLSVLATERLDDVEKMVSSLSTRANSFLTSSSLMFITASGFWVFRALVACNEQSCNQQAP